MDQVGQIVQLALGAATFVAVVLSIINRIEDRAEARAARARTEAIATTAATHASTAVAKVENMAENVAVLVENTNGVSQRLEALADKVGEARGIEIGRAEAKAEAENEPKK